MADNKNLKDGDGNTFVMALLDVASVFFAKGVKHNASGNPDAYGSGANGATVPRVSLATDSPGVTALGQGAKAASLPVTMASDQGFVTQGFSAAATFTPAAASHVANDCNGAAAQFTAMGVSGSRIMITSATLEIDGATVEVTAWRLYLYNITPPSATADDGAWDLPSGDRASFLGYVDLGTAVDLGSTQWVETHGINKQVMLAGANLFGYLVNLTTLTPAAVAHIVTLHAVGL